MSAAKSGTMSPGEYICQNFLYYKHDILLCSLKPKRKSDTGKQSELQIFFNAFHTVVLKISLLETVEHNKYTGCPRMNGQNFGRVFLMLNYTDITQNTYIQS